MTEAQIIEQPITSRATVLAGSTAVLAARVFALTMAFFVVLSVLSESNFGVGAIQPLALSAMLVAAALARRSLTSIVAVAYVLMFLVFLLLRPIADQTFIPIHYDYPILLDRILFLGALPMVTLQDLFYVPGRLGALDLFFAGVYVTYFFAPHVLALAVWRTRPQLFPRAAAAISLMFIIGLFFYFIIPTSPPWLASDRGDIDADVVRIMPEVVAQLAGNTYDEASRAVGENDVAAMPSLHTGLTAMVALIMASYGRRWCWVGLTYLVLMAMALVYLGEHYVIDEIGGIALAVGVWKLVSTHSTFAWLSPRAEADDDISAPILVGDRAA